MLRSPAATVVTLAEAPCLLVMLDYDGTLSPIVRLPAEAAPLPGAMELLERLASLPGTLLAVISGRSMSDLTERVPCQDILLFGNHGLECRGLPLRPPVPLYELNARATALAGVLGERLSPFDGVLVENKGPVVSVHYRQAAEGREGDILSAVTGLASVEKGVRLVSGKKVVELRPDLPVDKGTAVRSLIAEAAERCGREPMAIYAGDDTTDEDAFAAMGGGVSILIAERDRPTRASYRLDGPGELVGFLAEVERERRARTAP